MHRSCNHLYSCFVGPQTTLLDQISTFPQTTAATSQSSFPRKTLISIVIVAAVLFVVLLFALFYVRMKKTGKWSAQCHFIKAKKKDTNKNLRDDKKQGWFDVFSFILYKNTIALYTHTHTHTLVV